MVSPDVRGSAVSTRNGTTAGKNQKFLLAFPQEVDVPLIPSFPSVSSFLSEAPRKCSSIARDTLASVDCA